MDIIDFALKMEMDGKAYYEKLAGQTKNPDLKEILATLAEEEQRHYDYFNRLKANPEDMSGGEKLTGSETLHRVKNIFEHLVAAKAEDPYGEDVVSAWTHALRNEEKSEKFYREKADEEKQGGRKKLLMRLAGEEKNHIHMIFGVIMYLKAPEAFAASSQYKEFRSLEGWGQGF